MQFRCSFVQITLCTFLVLLGGSATFVAGQEAETRRGLSDFDQTTVLDNLFNPAFSFLGDFVFSYGDEDAREAGADGFLLRGAELGIFGAVDESLEYHGIIFFDEEEIELEEAYVIARDWLPDRLWLKAGRYNIDFGKQASIHDAELPTVDKPSTLQEYLGGTVRGTGLELHWWSPLSDSSLFRVSGGILQSADSDAHVVLGPAGGHEHGEDEEEVEGPIRDVEDFSTYLRASALFDLNETSTLQVGASLLNAPTRQFAVVGGTAVEDDERDLDRTLTGLDLTYIDQNEETGEGYTVQTEWLFSDADFGEDTGSVFDVTGEKASGFYALLEYHPSAQWTFGVSGSLYEHAEDADEESSDIGTFATWNMNEFNRLRFEVRSFSDLAFEEDGVEEKLDFVAFTIQWTVILGSHGHGLDW